MNKAIPAAIKLAIAAERFLDALDSPIERDDVTNWSARYHASEDYLRHCLQDWKRAAKRDGIDLAETKTTE